MWWHALARGSANLSAPLRRTLQPSVSTSIFPLRFSRCVINSPITSFFSTQHDGDASRETLEQATTWEGLNYFIDDPAASPAGRAWRTLELRRKSFDDLHKLWFVLVRERNMLHSQKLVAKRNGIEMPDFNRIKKVGHSMNRIRRVLNERRLIQQYNERVLNGNTPTETGGAEEDILPEASATLTYQDELRMRMEIHGEEKHLARRKAQRRKHAFRKGKRGYGLFGGTDRKSRQKKRMAKKYSRENMFSDS